MDNYYYDKETDSLIIRFDPEMMKNTLLEIEVDSKIMRIRIPNILKMIQKSSENASSEVSEQPFEEQKGEQLKLPFKEKQ